MVCLAGRELYLPESEFKQLAAIIRMRKWCPYQRIPTVSGEGGDDPQRKLWIPVHINFGMDFYGMEGSIPYIRSTWTG